MQVDIKRLEKSELYSDCKEDCPKIWDKLR